MITVSLLNLMLYLASIVTYAVSTMTSSIYRQIKFSDIVLIGFTLILYSVGLYGQYQILTFSFITIIQFFSLLLLLIHLVLEIYYFINKIELNTKHIIVIFGLWLVWTVLGIISQILLMLP